MTSKRLFAVVLTISVALVFASCGGSKESKAKPVEEQKFVLHMGGGATPTHPVYPDIEAFRDELLQRSNGSLELVIDLSGALGSDREVIEGVMNGSIEMMFMADISIGTVIPKMAYVNLPYLFQTRADAEKYYLYGWIGDAVKKTLEENNMVVAGNFMEGDFRWMSNSKHPITKPADFKNLKMRVVESPMYVKFFTELGTQPVGMSVSEVAAALQQRVIDGQDNGPVNTFFYGFYEFLPYMTKTNHAYAATAFVINKGVLDKMSPSQKALLLELADKYSKQGYEHVKQTIDGFCAKMTEKGMTILETTPELTKFMSAAARKVWVDESITKNYDQDVMKRIISEFGASN